MADRIRPGYCQVHSDTLEDIAGRRGSSPIEINGDWAYVTSVEGYRYAARLDPAA